MSQPERFEVLIVGSGQGGKLLAWHMAQSGRRTAVVERHWIGGSCPNDAADSKARLEDLCLPYRPKRRTKAQIAREAGLEPLAEALLPTRRA